MSPVGSTADGVPEALSAAADLLAHALSDGALLGTIAPALYSDLFEELEKGGEGTDELLEGHRRRTSALRSAASGDPYDPWDVLSGISWALKIAGSGCAPGLREQLEGVRQALVLEMRT